MEVYTVYIQICTSLLSIYTVHTIYVYINIYIRCIEKAIFKINPRLFVFQVPSLFPFHNFSFLLERLYDVEITSNIFISLSYIDNIQYVYSAE